MQARTRWVLGGTLLALIAVLLAPRSQVEGPFVPASLDEVVARVPAGAEARQARAAARAARVEGATSGLAPGPSEALGTAPNDGGEPVAKPSDVR